MNKNKFISQLDQAEIESAIARAESATSGEIRVAIMQHPAGNPVAAAQDLFQNLGMAETQHRNSVLILVAPASQTFAVIGDEAVHQKCGAIFWEELAAAMAGCLRQGDFTGGLRQGIEKAGTLLATHFPRRPDDRNELPNEVIEA